MPFYTTSRCVGELNRMCVDVCPVQCIHAEEGVDRMAFIDPGACIDCAACVPACPVSAIFAEADLPPAERSFIQVTALYFTDRAAARARVPATA
ncbi:MAG: 4Fe-4S ferredoxin [Chloroflexi bacterium]|nr:4Fe-4S ferredoxin [Chloroflexota bacterium]